MVAGVIRSVDELDDGLFSEIEEMTQRGGDGKPERQAEVPGSLAELVQQRGRSAITPTAAPGGQGAVAVEVARARGRSWNHIAVALGVSRQAARQRFARRETRGLA